MSQGANPWSDLGCSEALRVLGRNLEPAVADAADSDAREQMMWAATLAGIAFGNAGVHAPHGMAYAVAGLVRDFHPAGYPPGEPMVPHGMSVIVNAPAVFASPHRPARSGTPRRPGCWAPTPEAPVPTTRARCSRPSSSASCARWACPMALAGGLHR